MRFKNFAPKILSAFLAVCAIASSLCLSSNEADAWVYADYLSSNTALKESYVSHAPSGPVISDIEYTTDTVARFDMFEVSFQLSAAYVNPFDPEDIQVDGVFVFPSGKEVTVPAFFIEPMETIKDGKTLMSYNPANYNSTGDREWRIRFSGDEVGTYTFYIKAKDKRGRKATTDTFKIYMYEGGNKGYAATSEENPAFIINTGDGTPCYNTGSNIPWVRNQFTTNPDHLSYNYFINRATGFTNTTRVWICHYNWLEWHPDVTGSAGGYSSASYAGLGYYNQCISTAFDEIIQMCEDSGIRIILCTDDNNEHFKEEEYGCWGYNPYNIINGGFVATQEEYFANAEVRRQYKKRLRYIIARWGYSPALFSINMWNDMQEPTDDIVSYLKELGEYTHSLTDGWRPLFFGSNFNRAANDVLDLTVQLINLADGTKPYVTQECYAAADDLRNTLRNSIWSELVRGAAGTLYWSQDQIDEDAGGEGCWDLFKHVLDFTSDIPFDSSGKFKYSELDIHAQTVVTPSDSYQSVTSIKPYGDISGWDQKATLNNFDVDTSVAGMNLAGFTSKLYGYKWKDTCKNPPTFNVNTPNGGFVIVGVGEASHGTLQITVDGVVEAETKFINPETGDMKRHQVCDELKYTSVPLSPGKHSVKLDNILADWIGADEIYFVCNVPTADDILSAQAMVSDTAAIAYIENLSYDRISTILLGNTSTDFKNISFTVEGLTDGRYALYPFNPDTGEYGETKVVFVENGKVKVSIDSIHHDYAIKLLKLEGRETASEGSRFVPLQLTSRSPVEGSFREPPGYVPPCTHIYDNVLDANCNYCGERRTLTYTGWINLTGWQYYTNGVLNTNKWLRDSMGWCYAGADGYLVKDCWQSDSAGWCYIGSNGYMVKNQWLETEKGTFFIDANGYRATNAWKMRASRWFYFGSNGAMVKNDWITSGGKDYYLLSNGAMATNQWVQDSKGWRYLKGDGTVMTNGWMRDSQGWCYLGADGYCATNCWRKDSIGWVYLDENGRMATNRWVRDSIGWCYVDSDGYAVTNQWKQDSTGKWCYLNSEGSMIVNNWVYSGGNWYYMNNKGYMVTGIYKINGVNEVFDSNGVWQEKK